MDIIHDKANKFINDICKKRIKVNRNAGKNNNEQIKQDSIHISDLSNACFYCQKIFFGPEFLVKHILRRHSKELILLYKKCLKPETNNNSSDMKYLLSFLEKEFAVLKNELKIVQVAVAGKNVDNDQAFKGSENIEQHESTYNINEKKIHANEDKTETYSNELQVLKEKACDLEVNIECLHNKLEEMNNVLKTDVLSKQNFQEHIICNNEKILKAQESQFLDLGQTLLNDLQSMLSNQLYNNNKEWASQISELKDEIKRIDCVIEAITKQVSSPDYIRKVIDEKFGPQLKIFLGGTKNRGNKTKKLKSKSRVSGTRMNYPSVYKVSEGSTKFHKNMNASIEHQPAVSCLSEEEVYQLFSEKLAYFNIKPNTSKMSRTEFNEKLQLINCEKESLKLKYPNFSEIYNSVNMFADHEAKKSKLLNKKSQKIRFSEPLVSSTNGFNNSRTIDEDFHNKTHPLQSKSHLAAVQNQKCFDLKRERHASVKEHPFSENAGLKSFANGQGSGDCCYSFPDRRNTSSEEALESTPLKFAAGPIQISSPLEGTLFSQKSESVFSKISPDSASSEDQKKSDYTLKNCAKQDEEVSFVKDMKKLRETNCNHSSDEDYFDDRDSLRSLSSWED